MGVFKNYDIRGKFPEELSGEFAQKLGYAFGKFIKNKTKQTIVIGRDARIGSDVLQDNFVKGALASGIDVVLIGICTTPCLYFVTANFKFSGGVMITASHNPKEYSGFKFCSKNAIPIGYSTGLEEIEKLMPKKVPSTKNKAIIEERMTEAYHEMLINKFQKTNFSKITVVVDSGNGVGAISCLPVFKKLNISYIPINCDIDGNFPDRSPNPFEKNALKKLQNTVISTKADIGIAFDGDADRLIVVDKQGKTISSSQLVEIIAEHYLKEKTKQKFVIDLRVSEITKENLAKKGEIILSKVGSIYLKKLMRTRKAVFGGELSGHFIHAKNHYIDDGIYSALILLQELAAGTNINAREETLITENVEVENPKKTLNQIQKEHSDGKITFLDGITIKYPNWWFNARASNTEPMIRITIEASNLEESNKKLKEMIERIKTD
jgi:phosphomannomutase